MAVANPVVIGLGGVGPQVDGELRLDAQQVAPLHRPVVGKLVALEQPVDQGGAFVGVRIGEELRRFLRGGQRADDVQVDAPQEYGVGREIGGLDVQAFQAVEHPCVDGRLRGQGRSALIGRIERRLGAAAVTAATTARAI